MIFLSVRVNFDQTIKKHFLKNSLFRPLEIELKLCKRTFHKMLRHISPTKAIDNSAPGGTAKVNLRHNQTMATNYILKYHINNFNILYIKFNLNINA